MTDPMCVGVFCFVGGFILGYAFWGALCAVGDFVRWIRRIAC